MAITSLTRNQVVGQPARGFESHRLRWFLIPGKYLNENSAFPGFFYSSSLRRFIPVTDSLQYAAAVAGSERNGIDYHTKTIDQKHAYARPGNGGNRTAYHQYTQRH